MTDTYSPDRRSIVTFLSSLAAAFDKGPERDLVYTLVTQINRGDDLAPKSAPTHPETWTPAVPKREDFDSDAQFALYKVGLATLPPQSQETLWLSTSCHEMLKAASAMVAALSTPTITVATPRVLQSADEAPCGSLVKDRDDDITLRFTDGYGQHLGAKPRDYGAVIWSCKTMSPCIFKPITLIAEGLTEAECRHLSGLSEADALKWCEDRARLMAK